MSEFNFNEDAQSGGEYSQSSNHIDDQPASSSSQRGREPEESAFPDEDEETITMMDVIEREDKLEEEASAVLGNSDEKNCTYPKGYIPRQALYSCTTCSTDPNNMAAICLACSLECHDNHELIELYTKRNYRCDCGNSKFKQDFECKFIDKQTKKAPLNELNKYNHNFAGRYCTCDKRYPPDENDDSLESQDEMWQCISCEDWYHSKHLCAEELPDKFDELICGTCVGKLDFVRYYYNNNKTNIDKASTIVGNEDDKTTTTNNKDDNSTEPPTTTTSTGNSKREAAQNDPIASQSDVNGEDGTTKPKSATPVSESDTNDSQLENKDPVQSQVSQEKMPTLSECVLEKLKSAQQQALGGEHDTASKGAGSQEMENSNNGKSSPIFWLDCSWRTDLCRCSSCMSMYKDKECEYLLDEHDTVQYYEAQGKAVAKDRATPYERGMSALNQMNRAAVVEALHGYDELKADLSSYLKKFAETKKVVREEDIHDFFNQLRSKKRPRLEYE